VNLLENSLYLNYVVLQLFVIDSWSLGALLVWCRCLEENVWLAREVHHQGLVFGVSDVVWCDSRSTSGSLVVLS